MRYVAVVVLTWLAGVAFSLTYEAGQVAGFEDGYFAHQSECQDRLDDGWRVYDPLGREVQRWDD